MFTGIIQSLGRVTARRRNALSIAASLRARAGDSVAINGACLTVIPARPGARSRRAGILNFDVSDETWRLTNLGGLTVGDRVNLEPALRAGDAFGGHLVSGHVDARGVILQKEALPESFVRLRVNLPPAMRGLVALKGSIVVDGVSLTVTAVSPKWFETVLVPHTLFQTNLGKRDVGDAVNLEADLIARYVRAALGSR